MLVGAITTSIEPVLSEYNSYPLVLAYLSETITGSLKFKVTLPSSSSLSCYVDVIEYVF